MKYDWRKITTIAARYINASLLCHAHRQGVKLVRWRTLLSEIHHDLVLLNVYGQIMHLFNPWKTDLRCILQTSFWICFFIYIFV